ncbi:unnamed protein product, partial [Urochloa humidicola]
EQLIFSGSTLAAVPCLKELRLNGVTGSSSFWELLHNFTGLEYLGIQGCGALTVLPEWMGQLSALRSLHISNCSVLQSLPRSIQNLPALQELFIFNCPGLTKHYEEGVGDNWNLISHISCVWIFDSELVMRRLCGTSTSVPLTQELRENMVSQERQAS